MSGVPEMDMRGRYVGMCQRGVPSKGLWGRGGAATLEGGLRYTPLEPNMQEENVARRGQTETPLRGASGIVGTAVFEFASILSLVPIITSS